MNAISSKEPAIYTAYCAASDNYYLIFKTVHHEM